MLAVWHQYLQPSYAHALGAFWNNTVHPSVLWCSSLGYRHTGCLQLCHCYSHQRRADPSTDGHRAAAIFAAVETAIGRGVTSHRPRGDTLFLHVRPTKLRWWSRQITKTSTRVMHCVTEYYHDTEPIAYAFAAVLCTVQNHWILLINKLFACVVFKRLYIYCSSFCATRCIHLVIWRLVRVITAF